MHQQTRSGSTQPDRWRSCAEPPQRRRSPRTSYIGSVFRLPHRLRQASACTGVGPTPARDEQQERRPLTSSAPFPHASSIVALRCRWVAQTARRDSFPPVFPREAGFSCDAALRSFRRGLENRCGPFGPPRVRIPPPPLDGARDRPASRASTVRVLLGRERSILHRCRRGSRCSSVATASPNYAWPLLLPPSSSVGRSARKQEPWIEGSEISRSRRSSGGDSRRSRLARALPGPPGGVARQQRSATVDRAGRWPRA